jgi:hypothetical protein
MTRMSWIAHARPCTCRGDLRSTCQDQDQDQDSLDLGFNARYLRVPLLPNPVRPPAVFFFLPPAITADRTL